MEESETDAEDWQRFVGVAREGKAQIHGCLAPLRKVSTVFGKEKVQHYGWAYEGEKYCKVIIRYIHHDDGMISVGPSFFVNIPLTPRRSLSKATGLTSGVYFVGTFEAYIGGFNSVLTFRSSPGDG